MRVPQLSELCLRAVGKSCLNVADAIAANGGTKDGLPSWIKVQYTRRSIPFNLAILLFY